MIERIVHWSTPIFGDWGLLLVFLATFLETSAFLGLIVPGETVVILGGMMANPHFRSTLGASSTVPVTIRQVIIVAVAGVIAGDMTGYAIGRFGGRRLSRRFKRLLKPERLQAAEEYYRKHGGKTVFLGRFTPFLRSLGALVAGMSKMHFGRFAAWDAAGAVLWGVGVPLAGFAFGRYGVASIKTIDNWLKTPGLIILGLLIIGFLIYRHRRKAAKAATAAQPETEEQSSPPPVAPM